MERSLAYIEKINAITPIDGADNVVLAGIRGWQSMINKSNNYGIGDTIVYVEYDSVMPEKPEFEFLRKYEFKVKTQKYFKGKFNE